MKKTFLGIFLLAITFNLQAWDRLDFGKDTDFTKLLPLEQAATLALIGKDNSIVTSNISIKVENSEIRFTNAWPEGKLAASLTKGMEFIKSERLDFTGKQTVKASFGNKIVDMPYNKRIIELADNKRKFIISYLQDTKVQEQYKLGVPYPAFDIDLIGLYFQGLLIKNKGKNYNIEVSLADMRRNLNVDILMEKTKNFQKTSPEYTFPEKLAAISEFSDELYVFIVKPTGFAALFYPHKFYLFFENNFPYKLAAWWGGAPKDVLFFVNSNRLK